MHVRMTICASKSLISFVTKYLNKFSTNLVVLLSSPHSSKAVAHNKAGLRAVPHLLGQRSRSLALLLHWCAGSEESVYQMSLVTRKPVFGVCDQGRLKPACIATKAR